MQAESSPSEEKDQEESGEKNTETRTGLNSKKIVTRISSTQKAGNINLLTARPVKDMPGHTGYLTFATLFPPFDSNGN